MPPDLQQRLRSVRECAAGTSPVDASLLARQRAGERGQWMSYGRDYSEQRSVR